MRQLRILKDLQPFHSGFPQKLPAADPLRNGLATVHQNSEKGKLFRNYCRAAFKTRTDLEEWKSGDHGAVGIPESDFPAMRLWESDSPVFGKWILP
jgi:hypothetical protein